MTMVNDPISGVDPSKSSPTTMSMGKSFRQMILGAFIP